MVKHLYIAGMLLVVLSACTGSKSRNQVAIEERIVMFLTTPENAPDIFNYTPLSFSELSEYSGAGDSDTSFVVQHEYKGFNVANREVKRKAEVYFDSKYEVIGYRNTIYFNSLSKDSLKARYRTKDD